MGCLAALGTAGCPYEQPLATMVRALTDEAAAGGCNAGLLRDDALLLMLWITDEDDGSPSAEHPELFDPDAPLGAPDVRAALHPELLEPIDTFVTALRRVKSPLDQDKLVFGMIVGVPAGAPACIGTGDRLESCLGVPAMQVQPDPSDPSRLLPSCSSAHAVAYPPRRFVELAQRFGSSALVTSVCADEWPELGSGITEKLIERIPGLCLYHDLPPSAGQCDPDCVVIETLLGDRTCADDPACPAAWCPPATAEDVHSPPPCTDPSTGLECRPFKRDLGVVTDFGGTVHRQCLLRHATRSFDAALGTCGLPEDEGWFYLPTEESYDGCAWISLSRRDGESMVDPGSRVTIRCATTTCEE